MVVQQRSRGFETGFSKSRVRSSSQGWGQSIRYSCYDGAKLYKQQIISDPNISQFFICGLTFEHIPKYRIKT